METNEFGEKMIAFRAKWGLSYDRLARLARIGKATLIKAENGKKISNLTRGKIELFMEDFEGRTK